MKRIIHKIFKSLVIPATLATSVLYLSTILLPYVDTGKYWYLSIIGLGFPVLLVGMVLLLVFWLIIQSRLWSVICVLVILSGIQQISVAFGFHFFSSFEMKKVPSTLRVMQWNVHGWNQLVYKNKGNFDEQAAPDMFQLINDYNADVLCLEEFYDNKYEKNMPSNVGRLKSMGYSYFYFLNDVLIDQEPLEGIAIFSKYPIYENGEIETAEKTNTDPLSYSDIEVSGQRIRFIVLHLESVAFAKEQYRHLSNLKRGRSVDVGENHTIISKLKRGFQYRYGQAVSVNQQIEKSPYPVIVCGDFNDVPNSGTYFTITRNLQDAFLKKGKFIGRTFRFISPTLRIDYILPSNHFKVKGVKVIRAPYSDHFPVVADLSFNN